MKRHVHLARRAELRYLVTNPNVAQQLRMLRYCPIKIVHATITSGTFPKEISNQLVKATDDKEGAQTTNNRTGG